MHHYIENSRFWGGNILNFFQWLVEFRDVEPVDMEGRLYVDN